VTGPKAEALIVAALPVVERRIAAVQKRLPQHVDRDGLRGAALEALVRCAARYDPTRGATFLTFAMPRINGAMFDELREIDPNSRTARARGEAIVTISLDAPFDTAPLDGSYDTADPHERVAGGRDHAEQVCAKIDAATAIAAPLARDRFTILAHEAGYTLREISAAFGVTESRVSQMLTRGCDRARKALAA
jgi:RNA polymerase sigma factor (sigma-70 family)